jgi:hypothetical protein
VIILEKEHTNLQPSSDVTNDTVNTEKSPTDSTENAYKGTGLNSRDEEKPLYTSGTSEMPA